MTDIKREMLDSFTAEFDLPGIDRITQLGEDAKTAVYTIHFTDGPAVRIGTIETLWSRAAVSKVLIVAIRQPVKPGKPGDWTECIGLLAQHVIDVTQADDERFEETVLDWLRDYLRAHRAGSRDDAAPHGLPFTEGGSTSIKLQKFLTWVNREYHQRPSQTDVLRALKDLGFTRKHVNYGTAAGRTTTNYYQGDLPAPATDDDSTMNQRKPPETLGETTA